MKSMTNSLTLSFIEQLSSRLFAFHSVNQKNPETLLDTRHLQPAGDERKRVANQQMCFKKFSCRSCLIASARPVMRPSVRSRPKSNSIMLSFVLVTRKVEEVIKRHILVLYKMLIFYSPFRYMQRR